MEERKDKMKGLDLHNAMTEIDESFIKEADQILTDSRVCEMTNATQEFGGRKKRRKSFRIALIAACLTALLAGTVVAGAKALKESRFLELFGTKEHARELEEAVITKDLTAKLGNVTIAVEDIVVDKHIIYAEISTDYALDEPNGWLHEACEYSLEITGEAVFAVDEKYACFRGASPFCRDGKLWYLYVIEYVDGIDLGHEKMQLTVEDAENHKAKFEWVNNYTAKSEVITVNHEVDGITVTDIRFSLTEMVIYAKAEQEFTLRLDYIRLDDGTVLYYDENNGMLTRMGGSAKGSGVGEGMEARKFFTLLSGFAEKDSKEWQFVPYERIRSICINGEEIRIR